MRPGRRGWWPLLLLLTVGALPATADRLARSTGFSADAYLAHIKVLAADDLEGRKPGTPGIERAADYIARQFTAAGLQPAGDNGTWYQSFEIREGKRLDRDAARLTIASMDRSWEVGRDWIPLPFTEMKDVAGPLAFAGFGISAPEHKYDDFADFDPGGHVLLIFRYEPRSKDPQAEFGGAQYSHHAEFRTKAALAARLGAKALLVVNPPRPDQSNDRFAFDPEYSRQTYDLPMAHITPEMAEAILAAAGAPGLTTLQARLENISKSGNMALGFDVELQPGVVPNTFTTRNVVGRLPGDGTTAEHIVVGAHYDHVGNIRPPFNPTAMTPQVHNGADDNASGTAAVIELADKLAAGPPPRRSVFFVAFSAEEMGLLGSRHFVANSPVPLDQIRAMINFDMVGRLQQGKFTVFGIPTAEEFEALVADAAKQAGVEYRAARGVMGNSDHAKFYDNDIPFLFGFTGVHQDYHRPSDDWDRIDATGATKILAMFHRIVSVLANMDTGPTFQEETAAPAPEDLVKKPGAEHAERGDQAPPTDVRRPQRPKVRFGVIPDHSAHGKPGMVVDTVLDGSAAKAAGMQSGDRIIKIADHEIKDIYAYMAVLKSFTPDDQLKVVVVRDGKEVTLDVKLMGTPAKSEQR